MLAVPFAGKVPRRSETGLTESDLATPQLLDDERPGESN